MNYDVNNSFFSNFKKLLDMPKITLIDTYDEPFSDIYNDSSSVLGSELEFYSSQVPNHNNNILEVGCGNGRVTIPLLEQGFCVDGVDVSDAMLNILKDRLLSLNDEFRTNCRLFKENIFDFTPDKKYGLIIVPATTLCILASSSQEMTKLFSLFYDWLDEGGVIAFDYRIYKDEKNKYVSDAMLDMYKINGTDYLVLIQEFFNYIPGYVTFNCYIEKIEDTVTTRYLTCSHKRILTMGMFGKVIEKTRFISKTATTIGLNSDLSFRFLSYEK